MALTSRQPRPIDRDQIGFRDARLVVVATEGQNTEPQYFAALENSRIQIIVIPTQEGKSSPKAVLERIVGFQKKHSFEPDDLFCVVVDTDRWSSSELSLVASECLKKGYLLAVSNPCFELWLFLHFADLEPQLRSCSDFEEQLKVLLGSFNKKKLDTRKFTIDTIKMAIRRAERLDTNSSERWPMQIGTRVYKILKELYPG